MDEKFEYLSLLEETSKIIKSKFSNETLIDGELPEEIEEKIGNDFSLKFNSYLEENLSREEYLKIELSLSTEDENPLYLKLNNISEKILSKIENIDLLSKNFLNNYIAEFDSNLFINKENNENIIESIPLIKEEITKIESIDLLENLNSEEEKKEKNDFFNELFDEGKKESNEFKNNNKSIIEEIGLDSKLNSGEKTDFIEEISDNKNIIEETVENIESEEKKETEQLNLKEENNKEIKSEAPLKQVYKFEEESTETEASLEKELPLIIEEKEDIEVKESSTKEEALINDKEEQNPLLEKEPIKENIEENKEKFDIDDLRKKFFIGNQKEEEEEIVPIVKKELPNFDIDPLPVKGVLNNNEDLRFKENDNFKNIENNQFKNNINLNQITTFLLNKKNMIVLFIVIMLIGGFFYNKDKQTIKEEIDTANITQSINEITVNKIEIKDLKLSDNISYIIFNPATNRDGNTDISKKTVGELKEYLSSNLIKLKTSPDKLKLIAGMIIRIFSVNDKKTLSDFSVKDFVLGVK